MDRLFGCGFLMIGRGLLVCMDFGNGGGVGGGFFLIGGLGVGGVGVMDCGWGVMLCFLICFVWVVVLVGSFCFFFMVFCFLGKCM